MDPPVMYTEVAVFSVLEKHSVLLSFPKPKLFVRILYKSTLFVLILYWWLHNTECSGEMWNYKFDATWQWKTTSRL